jgi:hypothetical protein
VAGLNNLGSNPFDQVTLVRDTATAGSTDYNSIYLGTALVGTSMLGLMKPQKMQTPTYTYGGSTTISWAPATIGTSTGNIASGVITTDVVNNEPIVTVRTLVDYATASVSGYAASATDSEILTAKAVTSLITSAGGYYTDGSGTTNGGWAYNQTSWNTWTAVHTIDPLKNISFTLPVESDNIVLHGTSPNQDYSNELLPTSKAVATFVEDYFAGLAGGMRYMGSISSATLTPPQGQSYKAGDVFIASSAFTIGTAPDPTVSVELGDMVVIKSGDNVTTLTTSNCDVFERNLDGAITGTLTTGQMVRATASNAIESIDTLWHQVAKNSSRNDQLDITPVTNGTAGTATTITIDDIFHAKYVQTSTTVASGFKSVMVDGAHSADTTDHSGYVAPALATNVKIDPETGEIQLTYQPTGASTATEINVAQWLVEHNQLLEWHEL